MNEIVRLNALGIEVPNPNRIEFHDFGFLDSLEFYQRICRKINGRDLKLLEIMNSGLTMCVEHGSVEYYYSRDPPQMFLYVNKSLEREFPLNLFIRGHEEAHVLQKDIMNRYDLLINKLTEVGVDSQEFNRQIELPEFPQYCGGLLALKLRGITPKERKLFLQQLEVYRKGMNGEEGLEKSLKLFPLL